MEKAVRRGRDEGGGLALDEGARTAEPVGTIAGSGSPKPPDLAAPASPARGRWRGGDAGGSQSRSGKTGCGGNQRNDDRPSLCSDIVSKRSSDALSTRPGVRTSGEEASRAPVARG